MSDHHVRTYLRGLTALALECADRPWLWPIFVEIAKLVSGTIRTLEQNARQLAAQDSCFMDSKGRDPLGAVAERAVIATTL